MKRTSYIDTNKGIRYSSGKYVNGVGGESCAQGILDRWTGGSSLTNCDRCKFKAQTRHFVTARSHNLLGTGTFSFSHCHNRIQYSLKDDETVWSFRLQFFFFLVLDGEEMKSTQDCNLGYMKSAFLCSWNYLNEALWLLFRPLFLIPMTCNDALPC